MLKSCRESGDHLALVQYQDFLITDILNLILVYFYQIFISGNTVRQSLVYFTSWSQTSVCLSALLRAKTAQSSNIDTVCYFKNEGNQVLSLNIWLIFMISLASLLLLLVKVKCVASIF